MKGKRGTLLSRAASLSALVASSSPKPTGAGDISVATGDTRSSTAFIKAVFAKRDKQKRHKYDAEDGRDFEESPTRVSSVDGEHQQQPPITSMLDQVGIGKPPLTTADDEEQEYGAVHFGMSSKLSPKKTKSHGHDKHKKKKGGLLKKLSSSARDLGFGTSVTSDAAATHQASMDDSSGQNQQQQQYYDDGHAEAEAHARLGMSVDQIEQDWMVDNNFAAKKKRRQSRMILRKSNSLTNLIGGNIGELLRMGEEEDERKGKEKESRHRDGGRLGMSLSRLDISTKKHHHSKKTKTSKSPIRRTRSVPESLSIEGKKDDEEEYDSADKRRHTGGRYKNEKQIGLSISEETDDFDEEKKDEGDGKQGKSHMRRTNSLPDSMDKMHSRRHPRHKREGRKMSASHRTSHRHGDKDGAQGVFSDSRSSVGGQTSANRSKARRTGSSRNHDMDKSRGHQRNRKSKSGPRRTQSEAAESATNNGNDGLDASGELEHKPARSRHGSSNHNSSSNHHSRLKDSRHGKKSHKSRENGESQRGFEVVADGQSSSQSNHDSRRESSRRRHVSQSGTSPTRPNGRVRRTASLESGRRGKASLSPRPPRSAARAESERNFGSVLNDEEGKDESAEVRQRRPIRKKSSHHKNRTKDMSQSVGDLQHQTASLHKSYHGPGSFGKKKHRKQRTARHYGVESGSIEDSGSESSDDEHMFDGDTSMRLVGGEFVEIKNSSKVISGASNGKMAVDGERSVRVDELKRWYHDRYGPSHPSAAEKRSGEDDFFDGFG